MNEDQSLLDKQYRQAIEARDKLNENFHKWMTYYYVANGAILVAITSLYNSKCIPFGGIFALSFSGIIISIFWNLSCKGYYYWSFNWINIIIALEKRVTNQNKDLGVYSVFSQKVIDIENKAWLPIAPANISTPKLTLLFSFFSSALWVFFTMYTLWEHLLISHRCLKAFITIFIIQTVFGLYFALILKFAKSRQEEDKSHTRI